MDNGLCLPDLAVVDQRGVARPQGLAGRCDIGAYEYVLRQLCLPLALKNQP